MQALTLMMILSVTVVNFLATGDNFREWKFLPGSLSYAFELLGLIALVYVVIAGVRNRFELVRPAYWVSFGALLLVMVCGVIANSVESLPIIAGLRIYLRSLPWFFIPMVYSFSDDEIRKQLRLLLAISLVQVPIAVRQRINTGDDSWGFVAITGDWTTGTLGDAGILCIFLVGVVCLSMAFYERNRLTLLQSVLLFVIVLIPTTINETKAMIVFLPLALLMAFFYAASPHVRARRLGVGVMLLVLFGAIFIPVYDALNKDRQYSHSFMEFFSNTENIKAYLSAGSGVDVGAAKEVGRLDSLTVPLRYIARDPVTLAFGYGIGNASESAFGASGKYAEILAPFMQTAFSRFEVEIGLLGCVLVLVIYWLIFQDCRIVAGNRQSLQGAIAAGWTGVMVLIVLASVYSKIEVFPCISYLFWYFSGLIAAQRMRQALRPSTV